jgi:solute carrier family 35 protein C2
MCKSSSLAFVLLFAFLFRLERPSWRLAGIILIITAGVILMVSTETQFDFVGMIQVLSASALGGLRWSLTQMLLHKESMGMGNPIATLFWLAPIMGATLGLCSLIFDGWGNVFSHDEFWGSLGLTLRTCLSIMLPGMLAFAMNVTEFGCALSLCTLGAFSLSPAPGRVGADETESRRRSLIQRTSVVTL